ncbi:hypothetical protein [Fibrobacter sp. UBA2449]|uniref:AbiTii domain-containing protein n=1 Tax=Fibrobacter sp. UBA2449 TaxID=1946529 RepID=UPI0025BC0469|nr:hypothetical protein [Fibrobacter sp. UBA2449]
MAKMVLDLQQACLDDKISCNFLLLKAYAIAQKLSITDMADFCNREINGYAGVDNSLIPSYRHIPVNTEAYKDTSKRWEPVAFPAGHPRSMRFVFESIAEIEKLDESKENLLESRLNYDDQLAIYEIIDMPKPLHVRQIFMAGQVTSILHLVRKLVLDWALKLEKEGILGEDLTFSIEEQDRVKNIPSIQIIINGNVSNSNIAGNMMNSSATINNGLDFAKVTELTNQISQNIKALHLPEVQENGLSSDISEIKNMIAQKDESGIRKVLQKIDGICQNIAGNVVAAGIIAQIASILG